MNNNNPKFNLKAPKLNYFKNPESQDKAEDFIIDGYTFKMPKALQEFNKVKLNSDKPLISSEELLNKRIENT